MLNGGSKICVGTGMRIYSSLPSLILVVRRRFLAPSRTMRPGGSSFEARDLRPLLRMRKPRSSTMRSLRLQNSMDVVAFPAGFLVVDLHVKRQRTLARGKDRVEVIGEGAENILAGLLADR